MLGMDDPRRVVDCMTAYNSRDLDSRWDQERDSLFAKHGDRAQAFCWDDIPWWALSSGAHGEFRLRASRISPDGFDDPRACQIASLATIQYAADQAQRRAKDMDNAPRTLSGAATDLGAERSAAGE